jgi:hypothetical protein
MPAFRNTCRNCRSDTACSIAATASSRFHCRSLILSISTFDTWERTFSQTR